MDDARVPALRTARLIVAMEQFAIAYKRSSDPGARAEAYALWREALRDLADAPDLPAQGASTAMAAAVSAGSTR